MRERKRHLVYNLYSSLHILIGWWSISRMFAWLSLGRYVISNKIFVFCNRFTIFVVTYQRTGLFFGCTDSFLCSSQICKLWWMLRLGIRLWLVVQSFWQLAVVHVTYWKPRSTFKKWYSWMHSACYEEVRSKKVKIAIQAACNSPRQL